MSTKAIGEAVAAGMLLGRLDPQRNAILLTPDNMRGRVRPSDLLVPKSELAVRMGAAGAELVAWLERGRAVGVVWTRGGKVRYLEGRPSEVLSPEVIRVMKKEGW